MARVPHPTEIATLVSRQYPSRNALGYGSLPRALPRPASAPAPPTQPARVVAAAISDHTTAAFSGESFDDVQQMEEALDKMFRESEDEDLFLNLPNELFKPMAGNFGTRQRERQTRFKMSHGQNSRYFLLLYNSYGHL